MADFSEAQAIVRENEGGYANISGDKGGRTYEGISEVFHPELTELWEFLNLKEPIKWNTIFPEMQQIVDNFYRKEEWDTILGDDILDNKTADYFYDWHVNSGGAIKEVQKVIGTTPDGEFGRSSLGALNSQNWLPQIHESRLAYYQKLGGKFVPEWVARATKLYDKLLCA